VIAQLAAGLQVLGLQVVVGEHELGLDVRLVLNDRLTQHLLGRLKVLQVGVVLEILLKDDCVGGLVVLQVLRAVHLGALHRLQLGVSGPVQPLAERICAVALQVDVVHEEEALGGHSQLVGVGGGVGEGLVDYLLGVVELVEFGVEISQVVFEKVLVAGLEGGQVVADGFVVVVGLDEGLADFLG